VSAQPDHQGLAPPLPWRTPGVRVGGASARTAYRASAPRSKPQNAKRCRARTMPVLPVLLLLLCIRRCCWPLRARARRGIAGARRRRLRHRRGGGVGARAGAGEAQAVAASVSGEAAAAGLVQRPSAEAHAVAALVLVEATANAAVVQHCAGARVRRSGGRSGGARPRLQCRQLHLLRRSRSVRRPPAVPMSEGETPLNRPGALGRAPSFPPSTPWQSGTGHTPGFLAGSESSSRMSRRSARSCRRDGAWRSAAASAHAPTRVPRGTAGWPARRRRGWRAAACALAASRAAGRAGRAAHALKRS